jgi:hypothetical protein
MENDSATPKSGLSDRTTESSSQPSTGVVIFDSVIGGITHANDQVKDLGVRS